MLCFTCENALKRIARKPSVHYLVKLKSVKWCWLVYGATELTNNNNEQKNKRKKIKL